MAIWFYFRPKSRVTYTESVRDHSRQYYMVLVRIVYASLIYRGTEK